MSIATEAKVEALEKRVSELWEAVLILQTNLHALYKWREQLEDRGLIVRSKPGPKPKDGANG